MLKGEKKMKKLKCNAASCIYNKHTTCAKDKILVGDGDEKNGEIKCESYSPLGATAHNYEIAEETSYARASNNEQPHIDCLADSCVYNERHNCTANNVLIDTSSNEKYGETICETYRKQ